MASFALCFCFSYNDVICDYHFTEVRGLDAAFICSYQVVVHKFIIGLIDFSLFTNTKLSEPI